MSFKSVQKKIAKKSGAGMDSAGAILASTTRKNMKKAGMSTKHGIPEGVYSKMDELKKKMIQARG